MVNFRAFCDKLVRPEDSEIFANVACLTDLEDNLVANIMDTEMVQDNEDPDFDPELSQDEKIRKMSEQNVAVRASTSMDSLRSYEEIKAEKHFSCPLNIRQINNIPFTRLLRLGTNACCHFDETMR